MISIGNSGSLLWTSCLCASKIRVLKLITPFHSVMVVFGGGFLGKQQVQSHLGRGSPQYVISDLIRRDQSAHMCSLWLSLFVSLSHGEKGVIYRSIVQSSTRNKSAYLLILDFLVSRTLRNKCLLFKPPYIWDYDIAVCSKSHEEASFSGRPILSVPEMISLLLAILSLLHLLFHHLA